MEKQQFLHNFTILDHLPKIFNMMHIVNMMIFGLVVSQPVFVLMGFTSLHKSVRMSSKKLLAKFHSKWIFNRKFLNYIVLTILVLVFLVLDHSTENIVLMTTIFVLLTAVNKLLSIQKTDLPTNQMMHHWR